MSEWIPPEHREINEFLIYWGMWLRIRLQQGHCGSAEHRWRSPQCWDDKEAKALTDEGKALLVEHQMRIIPRISRKLLKLKYVGRADPEFIIKRLRLREYEQSLYTARQIVLNLVRHELWPTIHGRFHGISLDIKKLDAHTQ